MIKVARGLHFIKRRNIIHRDLKLENILLDQNFEPKISDFGWACQCIEKKRQTICGTVDYLSPELSNNLEYDFGVDVWSIGVMIYELICGVSPFAGKDNAETMENIKNLNINLKHDERLARAEVTSELVSLLEKVMNRVNNRYL